jgi:putative PIN family toxin of toxin-antitoxin system
MIQSVVLDTNIIVSAALTPSGNASKILALISAKALNLFLSKDIMAEYKRVLNYDKLRIAAETQQKMLERIEIWGVTISPVPSTFSMPDESDRIFYDAAKSVGAFLVTGNLKHYPQEDFIVTPSAFIEQHITIQTEG